MEHKYIQTKFRKHASDTTLLKHCSHFKQNSSIEQVFNEPNVIIVDFPPLNQQNQTKKTTINDFLILSLLGRGAYAKVVKAQLITSDKEYAIKIIDKKFLDKMGKQYEVHAEKTALMELSHPNIIKLFSTFQDTGKIYFVLEYCSNRDLAQLMSRHGVLPANLIKFYTAEIVSALEYMHGKGIYHRDLKLENITISDKMHLKIIDFASMNKENKCFDKKTMRFVDIEENEIAEALKEEGSSSSDSDSNEEERQRERLRLQRTINLNENFVGTADYVSPEVLNRSIREIGPACDLWALGVIIYALFNGKAPFQGKTEKMTFQNILSGEYTYDEHLEIPPEAKDIIAKLLVKDPSKRLGRGERSFEEIKKHPFFSDIDFNNLKNLDPPIDPRIFFSYRKYERISASPTKRRKNDEVYSQLKPMPKINIRTSKFQNSSFGNMANITAGVSQIDLNMKIKQKITLEDTFLVQLPSSSVSFLCKVKLFPSGRISINELSFDQKREAIAINEFCKVHVIDDYNFHISTFKEVFHFKHPTLKVAAKWNEKVNEIIEQRLSIYSKQQEDCNMNQMRID